MRPPPQRWPPSAPASQRVSSYSCNRGYPEEVAAVRHSPWPESCGPFSRDAGRAAEMDSGTSKERQAFSLLHQPLSFSKDLLQGLRINHPVVCPAVQRAVRTFRRSPAFVSASYSPGVRCSLPASAQTMAGEEGGQRVRGRATKETTHRGGWAGFGSSLWCRWPCRWPVRHHLLLLPLARREGRVCVISLVGRRACLDERRLGRLAEVHLKLEPGQRRDCHSADALSPSILKHPLKGEGGAAEWQPRRPAAARTGAPRCSRSAPARSTPLSTRARGGRWINRG